MVVMACKLYLEAPEASRHDHRTWMWNTETHEVFHKCHKGPLGCLSPKHMRISTKLENRKASSHHCFSHSECNRCQVQTMMCMHLPDRCNQVKKGICRGCSLIKMSRQSRECAPRLSDVRKMNTVLAELDKEVLNYEARLSSLTQERTALRNFRDSRLNAVED